MKSQKVRALSLWRRMTVSRAFWMTAPKKRRRPPVAERDACSALSKQLSFYQGYPLGIDSAEAGLPRKKVAALRQ